MSIRAFIRYMMMSLPALASAVVCGSVWADDEHRPDAVADGPRVDRGDVANVTARSPPGYRTDLTEISVQRWATSGRAGVGFGIGSVTLVDRPNGMLSGQVADGAGAITASGTTLMLGLRYRTTAHSSVYADATHVSGRWVNGDDQVVSKVGVEFKTAQSDWKIAYGGLGFRLAGDTRMTLKVRRSGLAVTMRSSF